MNTVAVVGRLLLSLAVVLGLMWIIARRVRRGAGGRARNGRLIDVLSRQQLSRTASVAVVRVLDQALILGITDGQINVLGETDLEAAQDSLESEPRRERVAAPASAARTIRPAKTLEFNRTATPERKGALAGSALSPGTWKQAVESLRDLTARKT